MLVIIALFTIISGGYILFFTLLAVSLIGMRELFRAMKVQDEKANILAVTGYAGAVIYYGAILLGFEKYGMMAVICSLVLIMFVYVFTYPKYHAEQIMAAFFSVIYVAYQSSIILDILISFNCRSSQISHHRNQRSHSADDCVFHHRSFCCRRICHA